MRQLSDFLKLRKQNDCVKIALLLFFAAVYFAFSGIAQVAGHAKNAGEPVEYVLTAYSTSASLELGLDELRKSDGAIGASFQREYMITSETKIITVTELSEQYLRECYGIQIIGSGKKIWLNDATFSEFVGTTDGSVVRMTYTLGDAVESAEFIRCASLPNDVPYAVSVGNSVTLSENENVRVMFDGVDISGNTVAHLTKLGYGIMNEAAVLTETYEREAVLKDAKYCLIVTALATIGGLGFMGNIRRKKPGDDF